MAGIQTSVERTGTDNLGAKVDEAQRERMMRAATTGYGWSMEQAPEDRGTLKQTSFEPRWEGNVLMWGYTQPYAERVEEGTPPYNPDPSELQDLIEWSERKTGDAALGIYVWEEKIPTEGIDPQGFARAGAEVQKQAYDGSSFSEIFEGKL